jgi:hypothetical protein
MRHNSKMVWYAIRCGPCRLPVVIRQTQKRPEAWTSGHFRNSVAGSHPGGSLIDDNYYNTLLTPENI